MEKPFTHLHVHTEYSLLDGSAKVEELVARAKELGMESVAITDHGVMYGVMEFYKAAKEVGVKPIMGCEVYVAPKSRFNKENLPNQVQYYHLVLLAENNKGYQNLIKIVSAGFLEGFYYKPRVDLELFEKYHEGIIALSACLAGPVAKTIIQGNYEKAKEIALEYERIFGKNNFFLELQDHGIAEQKTVNQALIRMNEETGIPLVATNDSHYIYKSDSKAHDILLCIQTGKTVDEEDRMRYEGSEFYFKSAEEMYELFPYAKEALENTYKIGQRCNVEFKFHELKLPQFDVPDGFTAKEYLRKLCYEGFEKRYDEEQRKTLKERLEYELNVIETMGYVDYFLIVSDFINYAKNNGIAVGPGRGSAAGSIVSYCLKITNIDPIKYDLLFERFLNPERVSMPDIDIDFCFERRQEVIDYVVRKYGADRVSQIVTFGTLAAKAAIKDVGRALNMPYSELNNISKMIPNEIGITIEKALESNPEFKELYDTDDEMKNLIDMSMRLEGLPRHASTHAAGVLICDKPVIEYVPLSVNDGMPNTQFTMTILEELGLLKMDFLGLRTLTVIQNAVNEIKRTKGIDINIDEIDYTDSKVYNMISQGKTEGVFQLESAGMKQFIKELQPQCFEDIIAGIALYRPGPMDFIPKYIEGKNNAENTKYTHPALEPILNTTYGCIVYQEQVMQIVRALGGYSLGRSDLVRRAMSKKKTDVMAKEREIFINGDGDTVPGCVKNGIPKDIASKIFDEMTDFAKYAFNKSHAAAYAMVSYQTAWLKYYYPLEFMAALMTSVIDFPHKVIEYIETCKKMNIEVMFPDINEGFSKFAVYDGKIVFALSSIKGVGKVAVDMLVEEREKNGKYKSMTDFCKRLGVKEFNNKKVMENLIKSGAFNSLGGTRKQYLAVYRPILDGIIKNKKNNAEGQLDLFGFMSLAEGKDETAEDFDTLPDIGEFSKQEILFMEKEVIGLYLSGHPFEDYKDVMSKYVSNTSLDFMEEQEENGAEYTKLVEGQEVSAAGIIASKTIKYTKQNKMMAFVTIEDTFGVIEVIMFPTIYAKYKHFIEDDKVILVQGRASVQEESDSKLIVNKVIPYEQLISEQESQKNSKPQKLWLQFEEEKLQKIPEILKKYEGTTSVILVNCKTKQKLGADIGVEISDNLLSELRKLLGEKNVVVK